MTIQETRRTEQIKREKLLKAIDSCVKGGADDDDPRSQAGAASLLDLRAQIVKPRDGNSRVQATGQN